MTVTHENTGRKDTKSTQGFMEDIVNALETAGVNDPSVVRKVAESLSRDVGQKEGVNTQMGESPRNGTAPYGINPEKLYEIFNK